MIGGLYRKSSEGQNRMDLFINNNLIKDIKRIDQVLRLYTKLVSKINQIQVMVPDYGRVRCDDMVIANIFSLTNLVKKYRIVYDSHKDDALTVHTNRGIIKFRKNKQGMYVFNTT